MDSIDVTDGQAAAVAKTDSRVTLAQINDAIDTEYTFTLNSAVGALHPALATFTMCVIVMKNGFVVTGESAPADPANFNADLGAKFARETAIRKLWPLMGFVLRDRIAK